MAKDSNQTGKPATPRRRVVRVTSKPLAQRVMDLAASPTLFWGVIAILSFTLVVGSVSAWTRGRPLVAVGQVMTETRTARVDFNTEDAQQTQTLRDAARQNVPRIYAADLPVLEEIRVSLLNLPRTLAGVSALDEVVERIRVRFGLSESSFVALRAIANDEAALGAWRERVATLDEILRRRPMLDRQEWQRATVEGLSTQIELRYGPRTERIAPPARIARTDAINIDNEEQLGAEVDRMVRISGFEGPEAGAVRARLLIEPRPTFTHNDSATAAAREDAAARVQPVRRAITVGQRIYARGEVLEQGAYDLAMAEQAQFARRGSAARQALRVLSVFALVALVASLLAGYIRLYCPKIARRPARIGWLAGLVALCVCAACLVTVFDPKFFIVASVTPVVLVAVLVCIAYDQRTALAVCGVTAILIAMAMKMNTTLLLLMLVGAAGAIAQLSEIRDRRTIIRMSVSVSGLLALVAALGTLVTHPDSGVGGGMLAFTTMIHVAQAALGGLLAGGTALFILPIVERAFDITTGMTLIELRDPKQPLLRELQQRAPGTYNHSLNVASIAENAAESIGANALLTYVGCLYHDIGKMNKPGYFVENQSGGPNKHDKLNPAMSLLIIIGHVKDGVEMARAHNLPKSIHHFIDAHHGTTLVEYFYRRARNQAAQGDEERSAEEILRESAENLPEEMDYRYPGPRPQTREVAIVMLADAVESATRTLADPTPSRIDTLVRRIAEKRLGDGQFDECDLTFRELKTICDSISKTLASIYHGRISYSGEDGPRSETKKPQPAGGAAAG